MKQTLKQARIKTQRAMILVLVFIIAAFTMLYVFMKHEGTVRASEHKMSFYQYVLENHIGQLTDIDDGAGFDPNSYILTVPRRVPNDKIKEYALNLMKLYVKYDHGMGLTILAQSNPATKPSPMANVVYNDDAHIATVSVTFADGEMHAVNQRVNWP